MTTTPPARLDPVRRLRVPRRSALLRGALVALLLLTAAGVLYAGDEPPAAGTGQAPPEAGQPEPEAGPPEPEAGQAEAGRRAIPDGMVGVPVLLGDPARLALLRPGDRVDLVAVPGGEGDPVVLAAGAAVLAVDHAAATLLLAATPAQARTVVATSATAVLAVVVVASQP